MAKKDEVLIIGDAMVDYQYFVQDMPPPGGDVVIIETASATGGSALNTAFALQGLNVRSAFYGSVGSDDNGRKLFKLMNDTGIDTTLVKMDGVNGYTITIVDKRGERTMFSYRGSSASPLELNEAVMRKILDVKVLLVSGYLLTDAAQAEFVTAAAEFARKNGALVMLDPSPAISAIDFGVVREILSCTDILAPNAAELLAVSGATDIESGLEIIRNIVPCTVVKNGQKGSILEIARGWKLPDGSRLKEDLNLVCPAAYVQKVIDTTGAGDNFNAGFIASFLKKNSPMQWLENANRTAADCISKEGGAGRMI